jgi:hypothetical protein
MGSKNKLRMNDSVVEKTVVSNRHFSAECQDISFSVAEGTDTEAGLPS